ncbi:hypothetical protein [Sorangium sp. So ce341]|uniref:hypothetical protein n=1 Tax=Sorangium sp. So ce341 TaxID=3133302 RepID=UPI003F647B58
MSTNIPIGYSDTQPIAAEQLVASQSVDPDSLRCLLESLVHEDCVHSWRNFGPEGTLEALLQWENARRPTKLFFFHLKRGDKMRLVAASAVADRLNRDFPHSGFCVLGRCCIMPEFRSLGLYRHVLSYRLEYCRTQFGSALNAIHIGAVNERISRVITNHGLPGWPRFIHLGEEQLGVAGEVRRVGAYLMFLPDYVRGLQETLAGADAPACVVELRNVLSTMESAPVRNLGILVKETYEEARGRGWFDHRDARRIEQLLLFCRSVPLVGFT